MKYIVEATEKKTLKEVTLEVNGTSKEEVVKAVTKEGYDTKRIESVDTHHVCKYCHGIAEGKDEELLCQSCRELFGHTFYSEL